jgi:RNA polymerase sigma-70 factor (ECF subfamily)
MVVAADFLDTPEGIAVDEPTPIPPGPPPDAGERLLRAFNAVRHRLFGTLYVLLGNYDDAQDALQVAFLRCWQARAGLAGVRNLRGWIWRVSLNAASDLRDRIRRRRASPLRAAEATALCPRPSPPDALLDRERLDRLRTALAHLRPEERDVFLLRHNGALTYEEIARLRGGPVGTVKTRMRAALRKLRHILRDRD